MIQIIRKSLNLFFFFCCIEIFASKFEIIVIGSGISGLSTASILSQYGKRVALLEQCDNIGGALQSFTRVGASGTEYFFEPGMHTLGSGSQLLDLITKKNITTKSFGEFVDYVYTNTPADDPVVLPKGRESYFNTMKSYFPEEIPAIESFKNMLQNTTNKTLVLKDFIDSITSNKRLKFTLSYLTDYLSFSPFTVNEYSDIFNDIIPDGGFFPSGSSWKIVDGALEVIKAAGGVVLDSCRATRLVLGINEEVEGVESTCGYFETKKVVSSIGVQNTYNENFIKKSVLQKYGYDSKVEKLVDSPTGMLFFLGFNESNEVLKFPTANIFYSDIISKSSDVFTPKNVFGSCLSARDPEYPKDRTDFFLLSFVPYELFEKWENTKTHKRPKSYYDFKKKFEIVALDFFFEIFPESKDYLDIVVTSSPLTIRDYLNHPSGSIYGITIDPQTHGWINMKSEIDGLWLVGQDLYGAGVQMNIYGGFEVAKAILKS